MRWPTVSDSVNSAGTVYRIATDGTGYQVLYLFTRDTGDQDGFEPQGALVQGQDGNLYGTTNSGGTNSEGTVFMVSPDGQTYQDLHDFNGTDGQTLFAGVIQASDGNLYGETFEGGANKFGTVFGLALDGTGFQVVHDFANDGTGYYGAGSLLQASDGNLYGTTNGYAVLFKFELANGGAVYSVVDTFWRHSECARVCATQNLLTLSHSTEGASTENGGVPTVGYPFSVYVPRVECYGHLKT